jgi:hypothetical protein
MKTPINKKKRDMRYLHQLICSTPLAFHFCRCEEACDDLTSALQYLKTFHRKPEKVSCLYEKLNMGALYEWFTPRGKLKPHLKEAIAKGITSIPTHLSILETRLELKY